MRARSISGLVASALAVLSAFYARDARADCTTDIECKGDRICVDGGCVDAPAPRAAGPQDSIPPPVQASPMTAPETPRTERQSPTLFAGGIVLMSIAPILLGTAIGAAVDKGTCDEPYDIEMQGGKSCSGHAFFIWGGGVGATAFLVGGFVMMLEGMKQVPTSAQRSATRVAPWVASSSGGLTWTGAF